MIDTTIKHISVLKLYGADGGDYKEEETSLIVSFDGKNEKAIINHCIEDVIDGEQVFEDFLKDLGGINEV